MKTVSIFDDVHRDVKAEAARREMTLPNYASELLRVGNSLVQDGTLKIGEAPEDAPQEEQAALK